MQPSLLVRGARRCAPLLVFALLGATSPAQMCGAGSRLVKNDILPDVPTGPITFGIVPGLCDNEAAMSIFNIGGPALVSEVAILYGHRIGTNGVQALADVEIYDGATLNPGGKYTLGPLLFKLSNVSTNLQIQSTAINTYTLPQPVRATSGKVVVGFRMLMNLATGSCATGYDANFAVDLAPGCAPGINVLDAIGHGPVDPNSYTGFGLPLCPLYFRGSWVIRACIVPEATVTWTGNATPGGFLALKFIAPGQAGNDYLALVSGGVTTGTTTPWGKLPLDPDPLFVCFLGACRSLLFNGIGVINAQHEAYGGMQIPNLPVLVNSGLTMYLGFVTYKLPNFGPWITVATPSLPIVIK